MNFWRKNGRLAESYRKPGIHWSAPILLALPLSARADVETLPTRPSAAVMAQACGGCHGTSGRSKTKIPAINGKPAQEFVQRMQDYKAGKHPDSIMTRIAKGYEEADFAAMAEFFEKRP